jgi:hypothetical protein
MQAHSRSVNTKNTLMLAINRACIIATKPGIMAIRHTLRIIFNRKSNEKSPPGNRGASAFIS